MEVTVPIIPVRNVQVLPNIKGNPPEGYIIRDVRIDPPEVTVTGSSDTLSDLQTINTESINIDGKTSAVTAEVRLIFPRGVTSFDEELIQPLLPLK